MRGRKPTPTVLKLLRGNPGKRAINRHEPHRADPMPEEAPAELTDPEARDEWTRTIAPAIAIGQITAGDRCAAIMHCELWATWRSQIAEASTKPHVVSVGPQKHPMPNPYRTMANKTAYLLKTIDAELGLTPASRSRVVAGGPPSDNAERAQLQKLLAIR